MDSDHLRSLLATGVADDSTQSLACPDEHHVAGYVDGGLDEAARAQFELHLADCGDCLALVALLCRERGAEGIATPPGAAAASAPAPTTSTPRHRWRLAPQWAAAAALVLATPLLFQLGRNLDGGTEQRERPDAPATRTLAPAGAGLQLLSPEAGASVDVQRLSFRWTEVSGTPYYDVRIVTDAGDVVIQQRVTGTAWRPPAELELRPGDEYFVHVDAYPSGDKSVSSGHVPFRVSD